MSSFWKSIYILSTKPNVLNFKCANLYYACPLARVYRLRYAPLDKILFYDFNFHREPLVISFTSFTYVRGPIVKHTQTIGLQLADELSECVWSFCGIGA